MSVPDIAVANPMLARDGRVRFPVQSKSLPETARLARARLRIREDSEGESEEHGSEDPFLDPYLEKPKAKRIKPTVEQYDLQPTVSTAPAVIDLQPTVSTAPAVIGTVLVKDGSVVLNDGREFDFENGSTIGKVFGSKASLVSSSGQPVGGHVVVPKSLMPGRYLNLPTGDGLFRRWVIIGD
jgi:hypothetical protein